MSVSKVLEMSLQVEMFAEQIYSDLAERFPDARPLFKQLAGEESRHADIVMINMKSPDVETLSPEFASDMVPLIRHTLELTALFKKKIERKDMTLAEALQLSLEMEESGIEAYFQDAMRGVGTHYVLNFAKQFFTDSKHHATLIKEFQETLALQRRNEGS